MQGILRKAIQQQNHASNNSISNTPRVQGEEERGSVEHKLRINPDRLLHLASQLKWRLSEGGGKAAYLLGVTDDGRLIGMPKAQLDLSLHLLNNMARSVKAAVVAVDRIALNSFPPEDNNSINANPNYEYDLVDNNHDGSWVAEVVIQDDNINRRHYHIHSHLNGGEQENAISTPATMGDIRVLVMGPSGAGKSTLIAALVNQQSLLDDGRGSLRAQIIRHPHELLSGRTTSTSVHAVELFGPSSSLSSFPSFSPSLAYLVDTRADNLKSCWMALSVGRPAGIVLLTPLSSSKDAHDVHHDGKLGDWEWCRQVSQALNLPLLLVSSKADVHEDDTCPEAHSHHPGQSSLLRVSSVTGQGFSGLKSWLQELATQEASSKRCIGADNHRSNCLFVVHDSLRLTAENSPRQDFVDEEPLPNPSSIEGESVVVVFGETWAELVVGQEVYLITPSSAGHQPVRIASIQRERQVCTKALPGGMYSMTLEGDLTKAESLTSAVFTNSVQSAHHRHPPFYSTFESSALPLLDVVKVSRDLLCHSKTPLLLFCAGRRWTGVTFNPVDEEEAERHATALMLSSDGQVITCPPRSVYILAASTQSLHILDCGYSSPFPLSSLVTDFSGRSE